MSKFKRRTVLAWTGRAAWWIERRAELLLIGMIVITAAFVAGGLVEFFSEVGR